MIEKNTEEILNKYREEISRQIKFSEEEYFPDENFSIEYKIFRKENLEKNLSRYENLCNSSEKILRVTPSAKDTLRLRDAIDRLHLEITPEGAMSFAVLVALSIMFCGLLTLIVPLTVLLILENAAITELFKQVPLFIPLAILALGFIAIKPLSRYPLKLANDYRLKASNQMVLCILYIVTYMRHTSNLENAIKFAGEHLASPLSLDLRKILWDVETGKFVTIKDSLDEYLKYWRPYNLEFIESFHLIEGSLYEPDETRRVKLLEKSLETILTSIYERMLHYAQELKTPITMLHMLGVILPILGLVIFPLMGSFIGGLVKWYHLSFLYNILLPIIIFTIGGNLLAKRPTGYSESEFFAKQFSLERFQKAKVFNKQISVKTLSIILGSLFILLGFTPLILHLFSPALDQTEFLGFKLLDFKCTNGKCIGPYSTFSTLISLLIPLGIAFAISLYYHFTTKDIIKVRKETLDLEKEFTAALFQLGNRVGDGIPVEVAFNQVAENMKDTPTGTLFRIIDFNIRRLGMSVKEAVFDKEKGALNYFPSSLIETSMKVLIQSAKKSPMTVSKSMLTISSYVKKIHVVDERLKDLLADIISSMKSQISFLTPMIAGIVIAVGSMITIVINKLGDEFARATTLAPESAVGIQALPDIINIKDVIPGFYLQLVIGLYVIQIGIILTILSSGIERGIDRLSEKNLIGKNIFISTLLYVLISVVGIIIFSLLASGISNISTA